MRGNRKIVWPALLLAGGGMLAAGADAPRRPIRWRRPSVQLQVGQAAPDFALPPLTYGKNDKGEEVGKIGTKEIKLSDFRGKAPVCIFSSSYT